MSRVTGNTGLKCEDLSCKGQAITNNRDIHLTKFPTLPVIFSIYLKTDFLDFFEILYLSRPINLQNAFQFSIESACKICRYSILIIRGVILKVAKNDKNTMCGGKG